MPALIGLGLLIWCIVWCIKWLDQVAKNHHRRKNQ